MSVTYVSLILYGTAQIIFKSRIQLVTYVSLILYGTLFSFMTTIILLVTYVSLILYGTDSNIGLISQFKI